MTGSYRLLATVTNGLGGSTSFGYQFEGVANDAAYEGPSTNEVLYNGRAVVVASRTVNPGFGAITADGGTAPFGPVSAGGGAIQAAHFTQLRASIQTLCSVAALGMLPEQSVWSSGLAPGGPSLGTAPTPICGSDLVDLRSWLAWHEQAAGAGRRRCCRGGNGGGGRGRGPGW